MKQLKETKADELFKKIGYIEHIVGTNYEIYKTNSSIIEGKSIIFQYTDKRILMPQVIYLEELEAINLKCYELGWLKK